MIPCLWAQFARFTNLGRKSWWRQAIVFLLIINIIEAILLDACGQDLPHWLVVISGILLMVTLPSFHRSIQIDLDSKNNDVVFKGMNRKWIIEYSIWNGAFVYLNFPQIVGHQISVLTAAAIVGLIRPELWLQARGFTLGISLLILATFPQYLVLWTNIGHWSNPYRENLVSAACLLIMLGYAIRFLQIQWKRYRKNRQSPSEPVRESRLIDPSARILVLGAGPSGISAAWFLKKHGYRNVTVFERQGQVGGFCRSINDHGQEIDLGATFVSHEFHEVMSLARAVDAKLEKFPGIRGFYYEASNGSASFTNLLIYIMHGRSLGHRLAFLKDVIRYLFIRSRHHRAIQQMVLGQPMPEELKVDFLGWLQRHRLESLSRGLEGPITSFGYGSLNEMPAYYGLRYITARAFLAGLLSTIPYSCWLPKWLVLHRFKDGYQSLWENVSREIDLRLNVTVQTIRRDSEGIHVTWSHPSHAIVDSMEQSVNQAQYDVLIVACGLNESNLIDRLDADVKESDLFQRPVNTIHYAIVGFEDAGLIVPGPLMVSSPPQGFGQPMLLSKFNPQGTFVTVCTRLPGSRPLTEEFQDFQQISQKFVQALGGKISTDQSRSFAEIIQYFHHYSNQQLEANILREWESLQGYRSTYYTGGLFDFDHVEGAIRASKRLIEKHFAGRQSSGQFDQASELVNSNLQVVQFMRRFGLVDERLTILLTHGIEMPRLDRSTRRLETADSNPLK